MHRGIESLFFDWEDWDLIEHLDLRFYGITMKVDLGGLKKGDKLSHADVNLSDSTVVLYRDDDDSRGKNLLIQGVKIDGNLIEWEG